jgi:predicted CXXCH cytochrome family protein
MADLFAESVHAPAFIKLGKPGCATCHQNHEIREAGEEMLTPEAPEVCADCHRRTAKEGLTILRVRALIDSLRTEYERADSLLLVAERAGMEVSQAQFELNNARSALVMTRAAVHSFQVDSIKAAVEAGLRITAAVDSLGQRALEQLEFRRTGLVLSVGVILTLIAGLSLKIRQLERKG